MRHFSSSTSSICTLPTTYGTRIISTAAGTLGKSSMQRFASAHLSDPRCLDSYHGSTRAGRKATSVLSKRLVRATA